MSLSGIYIPFGGRRSCMHKCSCGRDSKTFEACTPRGCNTFTVCTGCFKDIGDCSCKPT